MSIWLWLEVQVAGVDRLVVAAVPVDFALELDLALPPELTTRLLLAEGEPVGLILPQVEVMAQMVPTLFLAPLPRLVADMVVKTKPMALMADLAVAAQDLALLQQPAAPAILHQLVQAKETMGVVTVEI